MSLISSTIIEDIEALCDAEQASMAYFYFDFRNTTKRGLRDLLPSLLTQLSARSSPRCDILSDLYVIHDKGKNQPTTRFFPPSSQHILIPPHPPPTYPS